MRRFWHPIHRAEELRAGQAKPIEIMSERFTLYRGDNGAPHVVDFRCPHRGTQLSAGWQVLSLRALDPGKTVRQNGVIVQPYHPYTKASELPVKAGRVYEVWVEIFPTAAQLAKGDTLRISITPSDAPHLSPPLPQMQNELGGVLSVYHDAKHPSEVVLPAQR